ncbi:GntR family transcriptional regulator [Oceanobacillus sp. CFH 90083]|uniref:GntR family transcriptional regulator n=1 Tax=Oceanobacillus sp. CFH 90083 TaxID=2592336 RepID=UPI00128C7422|nr:GntR family transcriptional regulator [Oceanobacillus sp. CFH 90083]
MEFPLDKIKATIHHIEDYKLPQQAYLILKTAIRELILSPGSMFLEREITEFLEMSRTPVREAFVRLETEGLIRLVPRKGFVVEPIRPEDLQEIYSVIVALDSIAAEAATRHATDKDIQQLQHMIDEQLEALDREDLARWSKLDDLFHRRILDLASNQRLSNTYETFDDQCHRARLYTIHQRPLPTQSIQEHKAIVACMIAKNEQAAKYVMQEHRNRSHIEILNVLRREN